MNLYRCLRIQGIMPERALLKIRRANIPLFHIQKVSKTQLECRVRSKDVGAVFALYQDATAFEITDLGEVGLARRLSWLGRRVGVVIGAAVFALGNLFAQQFVFAVDIVGSNAYAREVYKTLDAYGVRPFRVYTAGKEKQMCAELFTLPGVAFCSVQKVGMRVRVELRLSQSQKYTMHKGDWTVSHSGTIVKMAVLKGTPTKKVGDTIQAGETLVQGWFSAEDGRQVFVEPIARVKIACVYEGVYPAESEEEAFAAVYMQLGLYNHDGVQNQYVQEREEGYFIRLEYTVTESINLS